MIKYVKEAFLDVCKNSLGGEATIREDEHLHRGFVAKIDVKRDSDLPIVFICSDPFLKEAANIMLFEENPDFDTLKDIACEIANLCVGRAKVIAEGDNEHFDISTPEFLKHGDYSGGGQKVSFMFDHKSCTVIIGG